MTDAETVARADIRRTIRDHIRTTDAPTWRETAHEAATRLEAPPARVEDELKALERSGFLYRVGDGASAEVKLP